MAAVNGDTTQDTTLDDVQAQNGNGGATMKVYGTNEPYVGTMVMIGGVAYTTVGGALEGTSLQLVPIGNGNGNVTETITEQTPIGSALDTIGANNPVVSLFQAPVTPRYRRSDNNQLVPVGANLHEHQDGSIMTEHSMGPDDNSVVVFEVTNDNINPPDENEGSENNGMNGNTPPPDITPPPGNGGGNGMNQGGGNY
jgi:hypothetical protein